MRRHWFPGGNTARGFHGFYQDILFPDEARRVIILKGGPGVGKSTFMRRMAEALEARGEMVEHLHCSGDPASLDGVVCRRSGFAMLDGTAPHIVDPEMPGAADSILNLGAFLDEAALAKRKGEIAALQRRIAGCYSQAYRYLAAALPLRDDSSAILRALTDERAVAQAFEGWMDTVTAHRAPVKPGRARAMFASAITSEGCVNYLETLSTPRLWRLTGAWGTDGHRLLSRLLHAALVRGMDAEMMCCPMQPERIEHLSIPALGLFVTTENRFHRVAARAERTIAFDALRAREPDGQETEALAFNEAQFARLLDAACVSLRRAKALHDALEAEYISRMDFIGLERCWAETSEKVLDLLGDA